MKITLKKCEHMTDWYTIERAEHDGRQWMERTGPGSMTLRYSGRLGDADIEGTSFEMRRVAEAVELRGSVYFKRCAVEVEGERFRLWSPRNTSDDASGWVTRAEADELAAQIRAELGLKVSTGEQST